MTKEKDLRHAEECIKLANERFHLKQKVKELQEELEQVKRMRDLSAEDTFKALRRAEEAESKLKSITSSVKSGDLLIRMETSLGGKHLMTAKMLSGEVLSRSSAPPGYIVKEVVWEMLVGLSEEGLK